MELRRPKVVDKEHRTEIGICGVCPAGCGVNVHLENGRIDRLTPLKSHPQGLVCARGIAAREIVYSPDRLLHPQKRVEGDKGRPFERTSWDHAYQQIVENLTHIASQYGPESIAIYTGRGNFEFGLNELFAPAGTVESSANAVLFPFGSPNTTGVGSLCYVSYGMLAPRSCFGGSMRHMHEDIEHADLILVWGANPATGSSPKLLPKITRARKRGARVIVIDHRRSETAKAARAEWIGIRPGTDGALALGALHVLITEDLYDHDFVEKWTHGFSDLQEYVRQFTLEKVEAITGVSVEKIRMLAHGIAAAEGFSILTYTGLEYSNSGVQAIRAVFTLQALAGHLDTPGGKLFKMPGRPQSRRFLTESPPGAKKPIGFREYPLYHQVRNEAHAAMLPKAILEGEPYPVRALIVSGSSLITSWPNPDSWRRSLAALDYLVVINRFPTADSQYADLLLPATTMFEIESFMMYDDYIQLRRRVIEPPGEARNDYRIFTELAARLGYGNRWPKTEEEMLRYSLQGTGVTLEELRANPEGLSLNSPAMRYRKYQSGELRADGKPGFETPTGRFEITSEWLRANGYEPLPAYTEPLEGPLAAKDLAKEYPLVFNSGARTQHDFRSQHHNIPSLVRRHPEPLVHIHPRDAAARGIEDGMPVDVVSPRGRVSFRACVSEDIVPGVVEANMGGGGPIGALAWQRSNINELTDPDNRDPISGFPVFKALLCEVVKKLD